MRIGKRTSLREIARICNLSPTTVSRIANGKGSFSQETRRLVLETMSREGYSVEDITEEASVKPMIGCLVADYTNEIFADRLTKIERHFRQKGIELFTCETRWEPNLEASLIQEFYRRGALGIIVIPASNGPMDNPPPIPILYMDYSADIQQYPNAYTVSSDDFVGGQLAAQELYRKGCRKPLILNIRHVPFVLNQRIQGFLHEYAEQGIQIDVTNILQPEIKKSSFESAKDLIIYHWTKGTEFDSIFCGSDWRAYGALVALRSMGVRVPEDIKIVGYDGIRVSRYCDVPITTIRQNTEALSLAACDIMWKLINNEPVEQHQVLISICLQEGKTT